MKTGKDDRLVIAIVTILAGVLFAALNFTAILHAVRQDEHVAQFFLGFTLIFAGIGHLMHRSYLKSIVTAYDTSRKLLDKNRQENQVPNNTSESISKPAAGFETPQG